MFKRKTEKGTENKEKSPYSILRWKNMKKVTPEEEEDFRFRMEENKVGFKDGLAMTLAALLVIVLPAALILIGCCLLVMCLLGVFW